MVATPSFGKEIIALGTARANLFHFARAVHGSTSKRRRCEIIPKKSSAKQLPKRRGSLRPFSTKLLAHGMTRA
jgi:hypothetical protein